MSIIEKLKKYFDKRKDVAFAFLFGSEAKGTATKISDIDIAIYFYPKEKGKIGNEEEVFYQTENEIRSDLENILQKNVELLVLNRVSTLVAASAIRGKLILVKDWGLYFDFMLVITREAEDFMNFIIEDYKERTSELLYKNFLKSVKKYLQRE
jgi:predicted nucleotidyltransferase